MGEDEEDVYGRGAVAREAPLWAHHPHPPRGAWEGRKACQTDNWDVWYPLQKQRQQGLQGDDVPVVSTSDQCQSKNHINSLHSLQLLQAGCTGDAQGVMLRRAPFGKRGLASAPAFIGRHVSRRWYEQDRAKLCSFLHRLTRRLRKRKLSSALGRWSCACWPPSSEPTLARHAALKRRMLLSLAQQATCWRAYQAWKGWAQQRCLRRALWKRAARMCLTGLDMKAQLLKRMALQKLRAAVEAQQRRRALLRHFLELWNLNIAVRKYNREYGLQLLMRRLRNAFLKRQIFQAWADWARQRVRQRHRLPSLLLRRLLAHRLRLLREACAAWKVHTALERARERRLRRAWRAWVRACAAAREERRRWRLKRHWFLWLDFVSEARDARKERARRLAQAFSSLAHIARRAQLHAAWLRWIRAPRREAPVEPLVIQEEQAEEEEKEELGPLVCRCIRCLRRYGHLGANPPQGREVPNRTRLVVTESKCGDHEHLHLRVRLARRSLNKALSHMPV